MVKNEMIVQSWTILSKYHSSLEQSLATISWFDELRCDLATLSTVDNDSLVADIVRENGVDTSVEHEAVIIELRDTGGGGQLSACLIVELADEGGGNGLKGEGVAVLELDHRVVLVNWCLNAEALL